MAQNTVFAQLIKLIPRSEFQSWVTKHEGDKRLRQLDSWTWFGALLFGQLSGHDSIRAIERVFAYQDPTLAKLGFRSVRRSTLADANGVRSLKILEEAFFYTLSQAKRFAPRDAKFSGQRILALDATLIELCLSLSPWAEYHKDDAMVKLHTAIDVADDLPEFAVITPGKVHDLALARTLDFKAGTTIVFDRIYGEYAWMSRLNQQGVFFVTRSRTRCRFKVVKCRKTDRTRGHICDQVVRFSSWKGKLYVRWAPARFLTPRSATHFSPEI
jgi:putative transposase